MRLLLLLLLVVSWQAVQAADVPLEFENAGQAARFQRLMAELRCLVCQNQSLADSHAPLAQDLRNEAHALVLKGASDDEVMEYMVARYGDFVRYRPAFRLRTVMLWLGPAILLALAAAIAWRFIAAQSKESGGTLTREEGDRLAQLLGDAPRQGRIQK